MKEPRTRTLADIAGNPDSTPRARLIATRRLCRLLAREREAIHDERRALRREAGQLRAFLPFTATRVAELERQADEHMASELDILRQALTGLGRTLLHDSERMDESIGFEGLCDLLNINPVHREMACRAGHTTISNLVFVSGLEDSVDRHDPRLEGRSAVRRLPRGHDGVHQGNPQAPAPDPFAPGAPFGPKLAPKLQVVGK